MIEQAAQRAVVIQLKRMRNQPVHRTVIDEDDYDRIMGLNWAPQRSGLSVYAVTSSEFGIPKHHQMLHRLILRADHDHIVDHINGDTLDNRKKNLRIVTAAENARNSRRPTFVGKTSKFKGVVWSKRRERWVASIRCGGVSSHLGVFSSEEDAARAYDAAAIRLFGKFARTNEDMRLFDIVGERAKDLVPDISEALRRRYAEERANLTGSQLRKLRSSRFGQRQYLPDDLNV